MARPIRLEYEGAVYHITIRGNERKALFKTDADRERFIHTLAGANLSRFMQRFQTAYTVYYNGIRKGLGSLLGSALSLSFKLVTVLEIC